MLGSQVEGGANQIAPGVLLDDVLADRWRKLVAKRLVRIFFFRVPRAGRVEHPPPQET
jgi:hypothetical protein